VSPIFREYPWEKLNNERLVPLDVTTLTVIRELRSQTANVHCERDVGTFRRDCLDHLLVWGASCRPSTALKARAIHRSS
jgi:hypothetical protein